MTFDEILEERKSVRKFAPGDRLDRNLVETFVKAAQKAPSWKNSQTARYHIVMSEEGISALRSSLNQWNFGNTENVQALVVTTFVANRSGYEKDGTPSNELGNGWGIYDAGLQNAVFILKAAECGIASLVMGIRDEKAIRKALDIPETETVLSVIALGEKAVETEHPSRKSVEEIVKYY